MQEELSTPSATDPIGSLEELLAEETLALVRLDSEGVQSIAQRKLRLCEELAAKRDTFAQSDKRRVERLQQRLRHNLILLAHAREHVQITVNLMTGRPSTLRPQEQLSPYPVRLDLRG